MNSKNKKEKISIIKSKKKIFYWFLLISLVIIFLVGFINIRPLVIIIAFATSFLVLYLDFLYEKKKIKTNQKIQNN